MYRKGVIASSEPVKEFANWVKVAKSEAIKEFAERLKATPMRFKVEHVTDWDKPRIIKMVLFIDDNDIDDLVKEMTEGNSNRG